VHIGLEKTGTTYLQTMLRDNAELLRQRGVIYPEFLGSVNHHRLVAYARDADPPMDVHRWSAVSQANQDRFRADLRRQLRGEVSASPDSWLLSCEHLSSRLVDDESIARLVDLLVDAGLKPRVVVFLRAQEDMIESTYSTAVLAGISDPFDVDRVVAHQTRYDFAAMCERWERGVGSENLVVLDYLESTQRDGLAAAFCEAAGIELEGMVLPEQRANESLPFVYLELLRLHNAAVAGHPVLKRRVDRGRLRRRLQVLPGAPFRLTPGERERVRAVFAASNAEVIRRYGVTLSPRPAPEATPRSDAFTPEEVGAFMSALASSGRRRSRRRDPLSARQSTGSRGRVTR
jgi:hypothetical protein